MMNQQLLLLEIKQLEIKHLVKCCFKLPLKPTYILLLDDSKKITIIYIKLNSPSSLRDTNPKSVLQ